MRSESQLLQFDWYHHHTSPTTHTHQPTLIHMLTHHLFIMVAAYTVTDPHPTHTTSVDEGSNLFFITTPSLSTHITNMLHTPHSNNICVNTSHIPQQHVGWVTPSSNTHNSTGDIFFQHAAPTPLFVAAWCYNLCCSSKHQHTHSNITIDDLHSSHNVFHNITVTQ